jgi:hypothetical protein
MTSDKATAIPQWNPDIITREVEQEIYLCSPDGDQMHLLADVAADLWRACDGKHSVAEIMDMLLARYAVDRATLRRDLQSCLHDMQNKKLIVWH